MSAVVPARSPWRIFGLLAGAVALATLNFSLAFVAFREIAESFGASDSAVSWTLTGFSITSAAVMVPGGWLADRYGRTHVFLTGFAIFVVGSLLVSIAPTVQLLVAARVVQAAGLAIESPASLALVLEAFPTRRRSTAVGAMGAAGGVAASVGPLIGGALVDHLGWRAAFFANVPAGILVLWLLWHRLPPNRPGPDRGAPDLGGVALLIGGVGALALGIVQSDDWGFTDTRTLASLVTAAVLLVALVYRSNRHPEPILHLPLFADHDFRLGAGLSLLLAGSFAGTFLALVRFLDEGWGLSLTEAGLGVGLVPAIGGTVSVVSGRLADRWGHRSVILPGAVIMAAGGAWMWTAVSPERDMLGLWLPATAVYGLGVGLGHAACQSAALSGVAAERLGIGGAMNRIFQDVGGTISAAIVVALYTKADDPIDGLRSAMVLLIVVSALSIPLAAGLRNRGHGPELPPDPETVPGSVH